MKVIIIAIVVATGLVIIKVHPKTSGVALFIYLGGIIYFTFLQRLSFTLEEGVFEPFLTGMKAMRGFKNLIEAITKGVKFYGEIFQVSQDAALNVLMFIPLGYLLPAVVPSVSTGWRVVAAALTFSLLIETVQQVSKLGMLDVFDLVFNTFGAFIGWKLSGMIKIRMMILGLSGQHS